MRAPSFLLASSLGTLALLAIPLAASGAPRPKGPPKAGELRVGTVAWSEDGKRLAVSIEKLVDQTRWEASAPKKKGAKAPRRKVELTVGVYACPGFEMQDGHVILDEEAQGPKARAAGWKRIRDYLSEDGFAAKGLLVEPGPLKLGRTAAGAKERVFALPVKLGAEAGAKLELTVLEGNPVLALLRASGEPARVKLKEFDAGTFELPEAACTLEVSPEGSCLALLCAQGGDRPYLGAYLLEARRLRVPATVAAP